MPQPYMEHPEVLCRSLHTISSKVHVHSRAVNEHEGLLTMSGRVDSVVRISSSKSRPWKALLLVQRMESNFGLRG